jgi:hypothetical protein
MSWSSISIFPPRRCVNFKDGKPDAISIPDAHLAIGQPVDGEILRIAYG